MTESELDRILKSIEAAIEVFRGHKGTLTASEISVKSMLLAMRLQVADQLHRDGASTKNSDQA